MKAPPLTKFLAMTGCALVAAATLAGSASAGIVTVGSPLTAEFELSEINNSQGTLTNFTLPEPGARATSPVNGVIVRWRVIDTEGPHSLQVLRPGGSKTFFAASRSSSEVPNGLGVETFPAALPIGAGQSIGLANDESENTGFGLAEKVSGALALAFEPTLGATPQKPVETGPNIEVGFNADVQPAPVVAALSTTSGFAKGGAPITITGTDFEGASAVTFGGVAVPFTLVSETTLTVAAPATAPGVPVPVAVTTNAGTATAPVTYTGLACVVPGVQGKSLKAAKKKILAAGCKVGKLKKNKDATAKTGRVTHLGGGKAGAELPPGSKLPLTLAPPRPKHR